MKLKERRIFSAIVADFLLCLSAKGSTHFTVNTLIAIYDRFALFCLAVDISFYILNKAAGYKNIHISRHSRILHTLNCFHIRLTNGKSIVFPNMGIHIFQDIQTDVFGIDR